MIISRKSILKYKILIGLLGAFSIFSASGHDGDDGWVTAQGYTLWSNTFEDSVIRIIPNDGIYNPSNCSDTDSYFVSTAHNQDVQQRIYSILLSAAFAEKSVRLRLDTESCEGTRPKILHVTVQ